MGFEKTIAAGPLRSFKYRLLERMRTLSKESRYAEFVMPVALLLVIDKDNGGDDTADEVLRRFFLVDAESCDVIDFYFAGWQLADTDSLKKRLVFDVDAFASVREALRNAGMGRFGGYADLVLLDAHYADGRVQLDFTRAIHVDLSEALKTKKIASVASFLEALIDAAHRLRDSAAADPELGETWWISDHLALAIAKKSIWQYILDKWGQVIGANKIDAVCVRRVGRSVDLASFGSGDAR